MIRRKDLDRKTPVRSKTRARKNTATLSARGTKKDLPAGRQETVTRATSSRDHYFSTVKTKRQTRVHSHSDKYDIRLAQTRGVFGMALVVLGVSLLIMVLSLS